MKKLVGLLLMLCASPTWAEPNCEAPSALRQWAFEDKDYFNPLASEPRAARTTVEYPAVSDRFPFSRTDHPTHLVWEITLGREVPIWGKETQDRPGSPDSRCPRDWGFGFWFPVSFHMIEYMGVRLFFVDAEQGPLGPLGLLGAALGRGV